MSLGPRVEARKESSSNSKRCWGVESFFSLPLELVEGANNHLQFYNSRSRVFWQDKYVVVYNSYGRCC